MDCRVRPCLLLVSDSYFFISLFYRMHLLAIASQRHFSPNQNSNFKAGLKPSTNKEFFMSGDARDRFNAPSPKLTVRTCQEQVQERKRSSSKHQFFRGKLAVSFREGNTVTSVTSLIHPRSNEASRLSQTLNVWYIYLHLP